MTRIELTGVEKIERLVQDVHLIDFGVTAIDDEGIANKQTCVPNSRARPLSCRRQRIAGHVLPGLDHPQVALDGGTVD